MIKIDKNAAKKVAETLAKAVKKTPRGGLYAMMRKEKAMHPSKSFRS